MALTADGATGYATTVTPFLSGLQHPVPLVLASDGTLFVGDWGSGIIYATQA